MNNINKFARWYLELEKEDKLKIKEGLQQGTDINELIMSIDPNIELNMFTNPINKYTGIQLSNNDDIIKNVTDTVTEMDQYFDTRNRIFEQSVELNILNDYKHQVEKKYKLYEDDLFIDATNIFGTAMEQVIDNEKTLITPIIDSPMKDDFLQLLDTEIYDEALAAVIFESLPIEEDNFVKEDDKKSDNQNQGYDGLHLKSHNELSL